MKTKGHYDDSCHYWQIGLEFASECAPDLPAAGQKGERTVV